jgi:methionine-rich copper-binding protein CopC
LFATPNPFTTSIDTRLIGQVNGSATLQLLGPANQVIDTKNLVTELEEVYTNTFINLGALPPGTYMVKYTDSARSRSVSLQKGVSFEKNWIVASPNPFTNHLIVSIKPPETSKAALRLVDAKGSKVDEKSITVTAGQVQTLSFTNVAKLQKGVYLLQYVSTNNKRTIRVVKQ